MIATPRLLSRITIDPPLAATETFLRYANTDPEVVSQKGGAKVSDAQIW